MPFPRRLAERLAASRKSVLLLGPRQVGKSTLISGLAPELVINLAHEPTYLECVRNSSFLDERLARTRARSVFVDEVQRLPSLLNTIQVHLDAPRPPRFFLTGSSARKLRRGGANLLPGRLHTYRMGPMVAAEMEYSLDTMSVLSTGTLPGVMSETGSRTQEKTLRSYVGTYLREEIQAEALTRNVEGFARFLDWAAVTAGQFLDLSKLANQAAVARQTATRFFEILEDTLIVHRCEAFAKSQRRRLVQHPKLYFFDCGVLNGILGNFEASADRVGVLFEHLVLTQIIHTAAANDEDIRVSTYRSSGGAEVDFIVERGRRTFAVEVKASRVVGQADLRGFDSFREFYGKSFQPIVAYLGTVEREIRGAAVLPWQSALREMGL